MKKLFVSVPMKGRTPESIKASIAKMHKIAEVFEGEELELIDTYVEETPPVDRKHAIWYLGKAIEKLSIADVFIGINEYYAWNGCQIETEVAYFYDIKAYKVDASVVIENYTELEEKILNLHKPCEGNYVKGN